MVDFKCWIFTAGISYGFYLDSLLFKTPSAWSVLTQLALPPLHPNNICGESQRILLLKE